MRLTTVGLIGSLLSSVASLPQGLPNPPPPNPPATAAVSTTTVLSSVESVPKPDAAAVVPPAPPSAAAALMSTSSPQGRSTTNTSATSPIASPTPLAPLSSNSVQSSTALQSSTTVRSSSVAQSSKTASSSSSSSSTAPSSTTALSSTSIQSSTKAPSSTSAPAPVSSPKPTALSSPSALSGPSIVSPAPIAPASSMVVSIPKAPQLTSSLPVTASSPVNPPVTPSPGASSLAFGPKGGLSWVGSMFSSLLSLPRPSQLSSTSAVTTPASASVTVQTATSKFSIPSPSASSLTLVPKGVQFSPKASTQQSSSQTPAILTSKTAAVPAPTGVISPNTPPKPAPQSPAPVAPPAVPAPPAPVATTSQPAAQAAPPAIQSAAQPVPPAIQSASPPAAPSNQAPPKPATPSPAATTAPVPAPAPPVPAPSAAQTTKAAQPSSPPVGLPAGPQELESNKGNMSPEIQMQGVNGTILYEFEAGTWINHLSVRPNGQLVITLSDRPEIHVYDPSTPLEPPLMAHRFPSNTRVLAMTEYSSDQYAVLGVVSNETVSATYLWNLRLDGISGPRMQWLCEVPLGDNFVSLTAMNTRTLLAASSTGAVFKVDVTTGENSAVISDATMMPAISSIRYRAPFIYYTNAGLGSFARIPINTRTGEAAGPVEVVISQALGATDIALAPWTDMEGYLINYEQNTVSRINHDAKVDIVMTGLRAPTAAQFGRTEADDKTLYIVTGAPLSGNGKIVSLKLDAIASQSDM